VNDPLLHSVIALGLCLLFASSGLHKLNQRARFAAQLGEYRILPTRLNDGAALLLMTVECGLALLLPWPPLHILTGAVAALLFTIYGLAIAVNLARKRTYIDCGCGDTAILLTPWLLLRNAVLAAAAGLLTLAPTPRDLGVMDGLVGAFALIALIVLYQTMDQLLENASALREWNSTHD
jgi:Methylamine utilisation protein MauE